MSVKVAPYSNPGIIDSVLSDPAEPSNATTEAQRALRGTWGRRYTAEVQSTWPLKDAHIEPFRTGRESVNSRNKWQYGTSDPSVSLLDLALVVSIMGTHVNTHRKKGGFRKKQASCVTDLISVSPGNCCSRILLQDYLLLSAGF